jgi:hypothetical protein
LARYLPKFDGSTKFNHRPFDGVSLADIPPGGRAEVIGFADDFPEDRKVYLQAYGLVLNHEVSVVQHSPVTIIRVDNIELALENDLARGIKVKIPPFDKPKSK